MKNKKAWLRIVEAFIAVLIVLTAVLIISSKQTKQENISDEVYEKQKHIFEIVTNNESLRNDILINEKENIKKFILKTMPNNWNFTVNICDIDEICNMDTPVDREVYVSETIITANLTYYPNQKPKKLRLFVWGN